VGIITKMCLDCGEEYDEKLVKCPYCGAGAGSLGFDEGVEEDKTEQIVYCPHCDDKNPVKQTFTCSACGTEHLCLKHMVKKGRRNPDSGQFVTETFCSRCWQNSGFALLSD